MKHLKIILAGIIITATTGFIGCDESPEKKAENVEVAEKKLIRAETELEQSESDSAVAYTTFRMETERILAANEIKMLELKARMITQKENAKTQYEKDLEALKNENEKLKANLEAFTYGTNENWEAFKTSVNKDIDRLGKSISAMAERAEKKN
jgi:hypothetical protein